MATTSTGYGTLAEARIVFRDLLPYAPATGDERFRVALTGSRKLQVAAAAALKALGIGRPRRLWADADAPDTYITGSTEKTWDRPAEDAAAKRGAKDAVFTTWTRIAPATGAEPAPFVLAPIPTDTAPLNLAALPSALRMAGQVPAATKASTSAYNAARCDLRVLPRRSAVAPLQLMGMLWIDRPLLADVTCPIICTQEPA